MKVIAIGGMPGTGKSKLIKAFLLDFMVGKGDKVAFKEGLVKGHCLFTDKLAKADFQPGSRIYLLGDYSDPKDICPGTDRLSMAVQPDFQSFLGKIKETEPQPGAYTVLYEGDRLYNGASFDFMRENGIAFRLIELHLSEEARRARLAARGSNQSEKFQAGRKTKMENIARLYSVQKMRSDDDCLRGNLAELWRILAGK